MTTQTIEHAEHQREMQKQRNEIGRLMRANHDLRDANREKHVSIVAMRETMYQISDLAHSGQIREMLEVIDNERRIYEAQREQRKGKAV